MHVLIGGVGHRWQRDASFGVVASDTFAARHWPEGVTIADLGYGALSVAQDIADAVPKYDRLVLVAAMPRDRERGRLYSYWQDRPLPADDEIQERVREAGAGVVDLDHLLVIAHRLGALPPEVFVVELEPVGMPPGIELSDVVTPRLDEAEALIRRAIVNIRVRRTRVSALLTRQRDCGFDDADG
jgi:hydrogenase maturation protease